ncbi:MAG: ribose-5-phosphate isomerase RpiA [Ktedonobacterales bacterium]
MSEREQGSTVSAMPGAETLTEWKRLAARAAVAAVPDGAVLGLGSGSTAEIMLTELAERMRQGLRVTGVPTSERIRTLATSLQIPVLELDAAPSLTLSIDGADEVLLPQLSLIKGLGGALVREKLIAASSTFRIIIVDASKLVPSLATHAPVPVEVIPFGWRHTASRLAALGCEPALRPARDAATTADPPAAPFVTDGGNYVLDCAFGPLAEPEAIAQRIKSITGVVDSGLFIGMTERVYVGGADGVHIYDRPTAG